MSKLVYTSPAKKWKEALPLGNGKTAAMIYGGKHREKIAFNDATLWSGYPKDKTNKDINGLENVRKLIFEGKNYEADQLAKKCLSGGYSEAFMPLGDLTVNFEILNLKRNYIRELDLQNGILNIADGILERECFISFIDKLFCYSFKTEKGITFSLKAKSKLKYKVAIFENCLFLYGNAPDYAAPNYLFTERKPIRYDEGKAMAFCLGVKIETDGEILSKNNKLQVKNATYANIYAVTETGFNGYDSLPVKDANIIKAKCQKKLNGKSKNYLEIKKDHIIDFGKIINKQSVSFGKEDSDVKKLLKNAKKDDIENALIKLFYDYGKYLIVSGSRDSQPLNLQGQWNKSLRPPWSSNLTTNINFQMNYWGAVNSNLQECLTPFYNCVKEIMESGKKTAAVNYSAMGFACNHNVDIWRKTTPVCGNPAYMFAPLCGVWLANEFYKHKKDEGVIDDETKKVVEEAAKFCLDFMTEHNGYLVTCPSPSPEAEFLKDKKRCALDYASAYDMGIIKQCFKNAINISVSNDLIKRISNAEPKLYPFTESDNILNEWHDAKEIAEKGHRHFSPLYALYPGNIIKYYSDGKTLTPFKKLYEYRLANSTHSIGWSAAWAMCLGARLHNSERVTSILDGMLKKSVFTNLFAYHPPTYFQIDGNLGFVSAVNAMLVYEEDGILDLLPAVYKKWESGNVKGFLINGITINFKWEKFKVIDFSSDKPIKIANLNLAEGINLKNAEVVERRIENGF